MKIVRLGGLLTQSRGMGGCVVIRDFGWWILMVVASAGLSLGAEAVTYSTVDELPEPDFIVSDRLGDARYHDDETRGRTGWFDLREIQGFVTDDGIAFAVFGNGNMPIDERLVVIIDVDGRAGCIGAGWATLDRLISAGYDYELGASWGDVGISELSAGLFNRPPGLLWMNQDPHVGWWKETHVIYFEVSWDQLGGKPEAITLRAFAFDREVYASDYAPDHGKATFRIP